MTSPADWTDLRSMVRSANVVWRTGVVDRFAALHEALVLEQCRIAGWERDRIAIIPRPPIRAVDHIRAARAAGVEHVVCGFLPDEVGWLNESVDPDFSWFLDHVRFVPFVFPALSTVHGPDSGVWLITLGSVSSGRSSLAVQLADAVAAAWGQPLVVVHLDDPSGLERLGGLPAAALVINDVDDWLGGFAIDELVSRVGCRSVRFGNPGYSPIRFGLLGVKLPDQHDRPAGRLRSTLTSKLSAGGRERTEMDHGGWFDGLAVAHRWSELFDVEARRAFWGRIDRQKSSELKPTPDHWLERRIGWSALAWAVDSGVFPHSACNVALEMATEWLACGQRKRISGRVCNDAIVRWVRRHPEWFAVYHRIASETRESRLAVVRWLTSALILPDDEMPVAALFGAADWALRELSDADGELSVVRAWTESPKLVTALLVGRTTLEPKWRSACVEGLTSALSRETGWAADDRSALAAMLQDEAVWRKCFGAAGPFLRVVLGFRIGARGEVLRIWRGFAQSVGAVKVHAGASSFVRPLTIQLLSGVGSSGSPWGTMNASVPESSRCSLPWLARHRWEMRCARPGRRLAREMGAARVLADGGGLSGEVMGAWGWRVRAMLASITGRAAEAAEAIERFAAVSAGTRGLAMGCAIDLCLRGEFEGASGLIARWSETSGDTALTLFLQACALHLLGNGGASARLIESLRKMEPDFLAGSAVDSRWEFAAILFKRSGDRSTAERMHARALIVGQGSETLFDETPVSGPTLPTGWYDLAGAC